MTFWQHFVRAMRFQFLVAILVSLGVALGFLCSSVGDWVQYYTGSKVAGLIVNIIFIMLSLSIFIAAVTEFIEKRTKRRLRELEEKEKARKDYVRREKIMSGP